MFQIKARIDYGLMIMFELAKNPTDTIPLSGIAKKMEISSIYLIQIAKLLSAANLIRSKEGARGGYFLARPAKDISILEIVEALEGKIGIRCRNKAVLNCPHSSQCELKSVWSDILNDLKGVLKNRSLATLIK
jgi:Rrf2 family protein